MVLDLIDQNKNTREIAKIVGISFRDIGAIRRNAGKKREAEEEQTRQQFVSSQAYKLLSLGKSIVQVAIELNIRQPEADRLYVEYLKMTQHYDLSHICETVGADIGSLIELHTSTRRAHMGISQILRLTTIANNDLPSVEARYETLKRELDRLQHLKRNLYNQVTKEGANLEYYRAACQREKAKSDDLRGKRMKDEAIVKHFENNEEYVKIRRTVTENVHAILSNGKILLRSALDILIESIKESPEKYSSLVCENIPSMTTYTIPSFAFYPYSQQQSQHNYYDTREMLIENTTKLYNMLAENLVDKILSDYVVQTPQPSLTLLPLSGEEKFPPETT